MTKNIVILSLISLLGLSCKQANKTYKKHKTMLICDYHIDLTKYRPIEFLNMLRLDSPEERNQKYLKDSCIKDKNLVMCNPVRNWLKKSDIQELIPYLDSNQTLAIPVYGTFASITIENRGQSTLANEAYYLIRGFRYGGYPPYNTIPLGGHPWQFFTLEDSLKKEILNWWSTQR